MFSELELTKKFVQLLILPKPTLYFQTTQHCMPSKDLPTHPSYSLNEEGKLLIE